MRLEIEVDWEEVITYLPDCISLLDLYNWWPFEEEKRDLAKEIKK